MVRGYDEYQHVWDAAVGETLQCHRKDGNVHNPYAVSIKKASTIVGHVPKKALLKSFYQKVLVYKLEKWSLAATCVHGSLRVRKSCIL